MPKNGKRLPTGSIQIMVTEKPSADVLEANRQKHVEVGEGKLRSAYCPVCDTHYAMATVIYEVCAQGYCRYCAAFVEGSVPYTITSRSPSWHELRDHFKKNPQLRPTEYEADLLKHFFLAHVELALAALKNQGTGKNEDSNAADRKGSTHPT